MKYLLQGALEFHSIMESDWPRRNKSHYDTKNRFLARVCRHYFRRRQAGLCALKASAVKKRSITSINTLVYTQSTLDRHLGWELTNFCSHAGHWVSIDTHKSVNTPLTINRLSIKYWLRCWSIVDKLSAKHQSRYQSSVDRDVNQVLMEGQSRGSSNTQPPMPLVHLIQ